MIARLSAAAATFFLLAACGGADESAPITGKGGKSSGDTASGSSSSGASGTSGSSGQTSSSSSSSSSSSGSTGTLPMPDDATACKLPELTATSVTPTFLYFDPPASQPAASKGGKIDGKYTIDKATVYLPTSVKGFVKLPQSTGTVKGWAIFSGKNYRVSFDVNLQVQPIAGAVQEQKSTVIDQGTFTATGSGIKFDTSCTGAAAPAAVVTFSENGARGTLLIQQEIPNRGTSYLVLEAARVAE